MNATYSPDDNKLRLYPSARLDAETYAKVKAAGFKWAPKQELFVAPMWTPGREDLLIELCGEIEDEDKSLVERATERAERFEDYSENRAADAESARRAVSAIADNIPLGQPILVGHHSERHARRDAEKIENGMRRAVKMWKQSEYWTRRAAGAIGHAKYKELPSVRARRIKGLESEKRKQERYIADAEKGLKFWSRDDLTLEIAIAITGRCNEVSFYMAPKEGDQDQTGTGPNVWTALSNHYPTRYAPRTLEEAIEGGRRIFPKSIARHHRWLEHYENRLAYERAMLAEAGGTVADRTGPEVGGGCKCWASPRGGWSFIQKVNRISVTVLDNWGNSCDVDGSRNFTRTIPFDKLSAVMTKAQVEAARAEGRLFDTQDKTGFILADQAPSAGEWRQPAVKTEQREAFEKMKEQLKAGVQVVSANQLFPTPNDLARRMVELADIQPGHEVLEPSAGTGALLGAMGGRMFGHPTPEERSGDLCAVEINPALCQRLQNEFPLTKVIQGDFLTFNGDLGKFDRILMNPPFQNGDDIKHIEQARHMLKPGGRIVAICANGPRQNEKLKPLAASWEVLPSGTFEGTGVTAALLVIEG